MRRAVARGFSDFTGHKKLRFPAEPRSPQIDQTAEPPGTQNTSETIMSHKPTDVESKTEQVLRDLRAVKSKELVIRQEAHGSTTLIYGVGTSQHRPLESIEQAVQIERIKAKSRENTAEIISFIEPLRLRLQIKREWLAARSGGRRKPSELQGKYPEAWAAAEEKFVAVASVHPN